jgi:hypothetical protein
MSDTIQHDHRVVYANALKERGLLASWAYHKEGFVVLPQTTPSAILEERIPLCVQHMDTDVLRETLRNKWFQFHDLSKPMSVNTKNSLDSLNRVGEWFIAGGISFSLSRIINTLPAFVEPLHYVCEVVAVLCAGKSAWSLKTHFNQSQSCRQNQIAYQVTQNNIALCDKELKSRGVIFGETPICSR